MSPLQPSHLQTRTIIHSIEPADYLHCPAIVPAFNSLTLIRTSRLKPEPPRARWDLPRSERGQGEYVRRSGPTDTEPTEYARVIFFSTLVPGSGNFQLSRLAGLGYGLGLRFWVVFTIIVSLTLTLTSFTTLTEILP